MKTGKSKLISTKPLAPVRGGKVDSNSASGPTGSNRVYPEGSAPSQGNWNPQKAPASKFFVGGVSGGDSSNQGKIVPPSKKP